MKMCENGVSGGGGYNLKIINLYHNIEKKKFNVLGKDVSGQFS